MIENVWKMLKGIYDGKALKSKTKLWESINKAVFYFNCYSREKVLETLYTMVNRFLKGLADNCGKKISDN